MTAEQLRKRAEKRKLIIQVAIVALSVLAVWGAVTSAQKNLAELGVTAGFAFLERGTGWSYSFALFPASIDDTYARTLFIGFANTLFVGGISIVLSTILGFLIGSIRDSSNLALSSAAFAFIQFFRNIPLILQGIFWYSLLIHMPGPRQSYSMLDSIFLSNRGLMIPSLNISVTQGVTLVIASLAIMVFLIWKRFSLLKGIGIWLAATVALAVFVSLVLSPASEGMLSVPELKGLRFVGGLEVSIELLTMIIAILFYSSAYIAEVVRGGLAEVPKGLIEAGQAVGLRPSTIWSQIKLPMALRSIIPPLGNQWIFVMKATTIGIAIGFSDLFMIVTTSITQSGQTLELIAILAGAFLLVNFAIAQLVNLLNARLKLKAH
ncbi:MAG: ABC transporter permease subunit [Pseudomonadota bacterium]